MSTTLHQTWEDHDNEVQQLLKALKNNDIDMVEAITARQPDIIDTVDVNGFSPLMIASARGNKDLVIHLLRHGANKDFQSFSHKTPLLIACENGQVEIAMKLIEAGADIHAFDKGGVPVIHRAVDSMEPLLIEYLVKAGVDVDERDQGQGWTPLMRCAGTFGDVRMARMLVHHGADVNAQDKSELTPIMLASNGGFKSLVRFLLSAGADAKKMNKHGISARQVSIAARDQIIVDIIDHPPPQANEHGEGDAKRLDSISSDK
eukprot:m.11149 g.11149  ORF g.11149 m.11149 type:complete len:261 (+) comp3788_c0_seq1:60-842(+)